MSFILDALKKAESERNRRVAPVLMDARIAPPRRGLPAWAWVLGAVLLVNLGLLAWLALRQPAAAPSVAQPAAAEQSATPAAAATAPPLPASQDLAAGTAPAAATALPRADDALSTSAAVPRAAPAPASASIDEDQLPGIHELKAAGVPLPELQLLLHVHDPAPSHRWVLLNGQRVREGEYMANGVKVERITPQGVVLEASGRRFRLVAGD